MNSFNKKAFTLAELLIAMFLFALIATMLVPNVTKNAEKSLFATQLKKVQNDIQQALLVMMSENQGTLQMFCIGNNNDKYAECFRDEIAKKLETVVKYDHEDATDTGSSTTSETEKSNAAKKDPIKQAKAYEKRKPILLNKDYAPAFSVSANNSFVAANLTNGATVSVIFDPNCKTGKSTTVSYKLGGVTAEVTTEPAKLCGYMEVDLNAGKAPNMIGKDIHYFWIIDKDGIVPFGELDDFTCGEVDEASKEIKKMPTKSGINTMQSLGCTYRLLQRGRIDYY